MLNITEYVSIEKQMLLDAQKYTERAEMYFTIGKTKHALGCIIKAYKKYEKYEQFKSSSDALANLVLTPMLNTLSDRIANKILTGGN